MFLIFLEIPSDESSVEEVEAAYAQYGVTASVYADNGPDTYCLAGSKEDLRTALKLVQSDEDSDIDMMLETAEWSGD